MTNEQVRYFQAVRTMHVTDYINRLAFRDVDVDQACLLLEIRMCAEDDLPHIPCKYRIGHTSWMTIQYDMKLYLLGIDLPSLNH